VAAAAARSVAAVTAVTAVAAMLGERVQMILLEDLKQFRAAAAT
jgi:hypothetical protein